MEHLLNTSTVCAREATLTTLDHVVRTIAKLGFFCMCNRIQNVSLSSGLLAVIPQVMVLIIAIKLLHGSHDVLHVIIVSSTFFDMILIGTYLCILSMVDVTTRKNPFLASQFLGE